MQLSEINPVLAETIGWDTQAAQDEEMVSNNFFMGWAKTEFIVMPI